MTRKLKPFKSTLVLMAHGPLKIHVIKVVRETTALGIKDAYDLVSALPKPLPIDKTVWSLSAARARFEGVGATVKAKRS